MKEPNIVEKLETMPSTDVVPETSALAEPVKNPGKKMMLFAAFFATFLLVGGIAGGYYLSMQRNDDAEISDESEEAVDTDTDADTVTWVDWEGEYLRARLPEGWSATESADNEYFDGLEGFQVNDASGERVFLLQYNSGLGWMPHCDMAFTKFPDYSPDQYDSFLNAYNGISEDQPEANCSEDPTVTELDDDYIAIDLLDNDLRRVGERYYYDSVPDNEYFEVSYSIGNLFSLDLPITIGEERSDFNGYLYSMFTTEWTEDDLLILDQVLESIEIIPQDEVEEVADVGEEDSWNWYTNQKHGFSIKVPKEIADISFSAKCEDENEPVPLKIFEDEDTIYLSSEYVYVLSERAITDGVVEYSHCEKAENTIHFLENEDDYSHDDDMFISQIGWKFIFREVSDDEELEDFIRSNYGSGCRLGEKSPTSQSGVYDISILGDGKEPEESECFRNSFTVIRYSPEKGKVVSWDLGQSVTFNGENGAPGDQEIVDSFRFD